MNSKDSGDPARLRQVFKFFRNVVLARYRTHLGILGRKKSAIDVTNAKGSENRAKNFQTSRFFGGVPAKKKLENWSTACSGDHLQHMSKIWLHIEQLFLDTFVRGSPGR